MCSSWQSAARVDGRIDHAVSVIADIYEAVLTHDDAALRAVVATAAAEVRRMRAEAEINDLLEPSSKKTER